MANENIIITITADDGRVVECEVIDAFECAAGARVCLLYTDNSTDKSGGTKIYAGTYDPNEAVPRLTAATDEEWEVIKKRLYDLSRRSDNE